MSIYRARAAWQLKRNANLKKVCDVLKKDKRCHGKSVEISWQEEGSKDRLVKVGSDVAFRQTVADLAGKFSPSFLNIAVSF